MNIKLKGLSDIGVTWPVMQAGMPGISRADLVSAVARAGGIGTLGMLDLSIWEDEIIRAKSQAGHYPIAVNLLLPFVRSKHVEILLKHKIPMVSLFWGDKPELVTRLKKSGVYVFQQVGSVEQAQRVIGQGVDALIVQGKEAGGHVLGKDNLDQLLPEVVKAVADEFPVFAAGGIYTSGDVRRVVSLGAAGVSTGTRFLLSEESAAHDAYKRKLVDASDTVLTRLFGFSWPDQHRVVVNKAVETWCNKNGEVPRWLNRLNAGFVFTRKLVPMKSAIARLQNPRLPFFSPATLVKELPVKLLECTALYAGENINQLNSILPARDIVAELAKEFK